MGAAIGRGPPSIARTIADGGDTQAAGARSVFGIFAQPSNMVDATEGDTTDLTLARLFDGQRHAPARGVVTKTILPVDLKRGGIFFHNRRFGGRVEFAFDNLLQIGGNTQHAM